MMAQLSDKEIRKYDYRAEVFITKIKEKSLFEVKGNKKVMLTMPKNGEFVLRNGTDLELRNLRFSDNTGFNWKLTDFVKTKEFGGKGEGSGTVKEDFALAELRKQINEAKKKEGKAEIRVKIANVIYKVADAVSTPGSPKSDFHLVDMDGKEIVWISHKDGKTAKDFQQWGGVSQRDEPKLYQHVETQQFIKDMLNTYPNGLRNATTVYRKIKDVKLKMQSVYGNEYGGAFSRQNTTLMLQGSVVLKKTAGIYVIEAHHTHVNGDNMTGAYEPVFMAMYKGDRSNFGLKGTRVGISPYGSRRIDAEI